MLIDKLDRAIELYEKDLMDESISLFKELANKDVCEAHQYLGMIYKHGDGVPKDIDESNKWYDSYFRLLIDRSESGDINARKKLASMYEYGDGISENKEKALELYISLAEEGDAESQFHLSTLFEHGWAGLEPDVEQCSFWLIEALNAGYPEAEYKYATVLLSKNDEHIPTQSEFNEATYLLQKAGNSGFWPAKELLETLNKKKEK